MVRLQGLLTRVDKSATNTSAKSVILPVSAFFGELAVSKTPGRCTTDGNVIKRVKTGVCTILYTLTDSDGNEFTTEKKILFRKQN